MATSTHVSRHLRDHGLHPGNTESTCEGIKVSGSKRSPDAYVRVSYNNPSTRARLGEAIREALEASVWDFTETIRNPGEWLGTHSFHITGVNPDKKRAARRARDAKRRAETAATTPAATPVTTATAVKAAPGADRAEIRAQAEAVERMAVAAAKLTPEQRAAARAVMANARMAPATGHTAPRLPIEPGRYLVVYPGHTGHPVQITESGSPYDMVTRRILTGPKSDTILAVLGEPAAAREAAQRFGRLFGICGRCGKDLTDPESLERGLGPDCAATYGL